MAGAQSSPTPLALALLDEFRGRRPTPLDALALARRRFLKGERVDVGALARELGIGRATLFRWVGSRELLIGEVLWSLYQPILEQARAQTRGHGAAYVARVCRRAMDAILDFEPLRRFIEQDPEYALRILTSKTSTVQARSIDFVRALIEQEATAGHLAPPMKPDDLAFLVVRIAESFLYGDQISGREPDIACATDAIRILLGG
ncbi:MAG TPA: QsdR family transcriptional regulator [Xanthomonadaceae bacterium]|nr:QsdR family transcriptional regulator [Xanthomonadaceae bacterium]